mmetsp:Transcript_454/g.925  ORF Transcript_454/g.925 Transcript_454/m.925 type:complete len:421 (-) Transcript_454:389-1651(-)|eukprot:CAMPEP_0114259730 /NCGR_PEP_ID=MMETSP0058-20121206/20056_1 /TAXON_ID=36894 /ORGANISM="Pyramimonas parkeae, CCMP726" /LENGTH=420 /DNA_ID=CAMNT_0001374811 /DNA_START=146 /DNA_END=1408 /DNA_ORIENTATION=+
MRAGGAAASLLLVVWLGACLGQRDLRSTDSDSEGLAWWDSDTNNKSNNSSSSFVTTALRCAFGDDGGSDCAPASKDMLEEMMMLLADPLEYKRRAAPQLMSDMCSRSVNITATLQGPCIPQMHAAASTHFASVSASTLPDDPCNSTSEVYAAASASVAVVGLLADFLCLTNDDTQFCFEAVADAISASGLKGVLSGHLDLTQPHPNISQACTAFAAAGCCSAAFFQVVTAYEALTCQQGPVSMPLMLMLPGECAIQEEAVTLPAACPGIDASKYMSWAPTSCPGTSLWKSVQSQCPAEDSGACPTTMCEFGCLAVNSMLDVEGPLMQRNTILSAHSNVASANADSRVKEFFWALGNFFGLFGSVSLFMLSTIIAAGIFFIGVVLLIRLLICIDPSGSCNEATKVDTNGTTYGSVATSDQA